MTALPIREAVARAICAANRADPDEIDELRDGYGLPVYMPMWQHYLDDADAALAVALPILREHYAAIAESYEPRCDVCPRGVSTAILADKGPK